MAERIDAFAHVLPSDFYEEMERMNASKELEALSHNDRFFDPETRVGDMDEFGIDRQVLTLARPPIWSGLSREAALPLTKVANDTVRAFADSHPDRFIPVGTIPFYTEPFIEEMHRCLDELDMPGIQIFSTRDGGRAIDDGSQDFFEAADARAVTMWLHPQLHTWHEWDSDYMLHKTLGWPFDTSLAMARLVFTGFMERYSDVNIVTHHMGGMIPHFANRLELFINQVHQHPELYPYAANDDLPRPIKDYFTDFYADTCRSGSPGLVEDGIEFYGADHIVYATDYPFGPDNGVGFMKAETECLDALDVDEATLEDIQSGNVRSLMSS